MTQLFRVIVLVSATMLVVSAVIPFDHPYEASFPIGQPPVAPLLLSLLALLCAILVPLCAYGLLRFRSWALNLATLAAIVLVCLSATALFPSDVSTAISPWAKVAVCLSAILWILAVLMTRA